MINLIMNNVLKSVKKIFTVGVVGTTMMWALNVSLLLPSGASAAVCPTLMAGDMIKVSGKPAIYSVNKDSKVLYFPSGDEFKSWNENNSYGGYVTVTQACFDSLSVPNTYPGAVNFRAGFTTVMRPSSSQEYAVLPNNTLAKITDADADALYGANRKVMTVADAFWPHYVNRAADIAGTVHEGMLVSKDGKTWYVGAGMVLREVTATGMTANRFKASSVHAVPASYLAGTTVGSSITALESAISNRTQDGAITTPTGGSLMVSLAADSPAATTVADGSAYNKVLKLNFSASSATNVTGITLTKTGLIANSNITGVSVWDSMGNRRGEVMSSLTSDNKVTISFGANPLMVGAGSAESLVIAVNIANMSNGSGLVGFNVAAATDVATNGTVSGAFPIVGNQMSIVEGSASLASTTVSAVAVGGASSATLAAGNLQIGDMQKELAKFRFTESSGNEDVALAKLTLYVEGTVQDSDLANWSLYAPNGDKLAMTAAMSNRYVTLSLATPYVIPKGVSRDVTVKADVVNGSGHTLRVHLQSDYDVMLRGLTSGFYVLPSSFSDVFSSGTGWFAMGSGTLVLNKTPSSPAGNVSAGSQNIVLASFQAKAAGEDLEVRKVGLTISKATVSNVNLSGNVTLRDATDGTVYLTVAASNAGLYTGSQFTLSSYMNLKANQTRTLEVVGSIDSIATSTNKYTVGIGNFYAKRLSTIDFADNMPSASNNGTTGNQLTANATSLSCYKDTAMGNVTRSTGSTTVVGQYICTAGSSEDVRLSSLTFAFSGTTLTVANAYQNLSLWDGATQLGSTNGTVASSSNNFSFSLTIPKNQTKTLQLKAYIVPGQTGSASSSITSGSYTGVNSSNSDTLGTVDGQLVSIGGASLTVSAYSDATTIAKVYGPSQTGVQLGKWQIKATNDDIALQKLTLTATYAQNGTTATTLGTFASLSLYEATNMTTPLATASYVNGDVVFTGFNSNIPMGSTGKVYVLKGNTNLSGTITRNTTTLFTVKSDSNSDMEARSAAGSLLSTADINSAGADSKFASSTPYIFHDAYPVVAPGCTVALVGGACPTPSPLSLGTTAKIFKFSVTNPGAVELRLASTTVTVSVNGLAALDSVSDFRLYEDNGSGNIGGSALAQSVGVVTSTSSTPNVSVSFNATNDLNGSFDSLTVAAGATRTFIMTANTLSATAAGGDGTVTVSALIDGSTGWSGTAWNTGNLLYYYTPTDSSEVGPYKHSDSYPVEGTASTIAR